jgi:hypothetical protein
VSAPTYTTVRTYGCLLCPKAPDGAYGWEGEGSFRFLAHARDAHQLTPAQVGQATGQLAVHMCGRGWSLRTSTYTLPDGRPLADLRVESSRKKGPGAGKAARP